MSYIKEKSDSLLYDLLIQSVEFVNVLPNLETCKTYEGFINWFEKLVLIDERALYIHLCKNYYNYERKFIDYAESRMRLPIQPIE